MFIPINVTFVKNNFIVTLTLRDAGIENWKLNIIERVEKVSELRHRKSYSQYRLDTFIFNELNERFVDIPML